MLTHCIEQVHPNGSLLLASGDDAQGSTTAQQNAAQAHLPVEHPAKYHAHLTSSGISSALAVELTPPKEHAQQRAANTEAQQLVAARHRQNLQQTSQRKQQASTNTDLLAARSLKPGGDNKLAVDTSPSWLR